MTDRVLICGSRTWEDALTVRRIVALLPPDAVVIHGAARGADTVADREARARGLQVEAYPADWKKHGRAAGPIRNQQMIDEGKPTRAIAFRRGPVSVGTDDMIRRARAAGVPVEVIEEAASDD